MAGIPIGLLGVAAPRRRAWGTGVLAMLFVVCWSSGFIGAKLGAGGAGIATVLMWRFVPLALVLLPVALLGSGRWGLRGRPRREVRLHVAIGLLSQVGYLLTVYWAIGLGVSTGTTALVDGVQPLVAAALAGPLLGAAVAGRQWVGLALGLGGVVLVSWSDAASPATSAPVWAYLVPFAGMLSLVASTILERRARVRTPPVPALAVHCATSAVAFTVLAVATGQAVPPPSTGFWLATAWLVILPTFGGYGLYWVLVERIGVTPVSSLMFLVAPVTSLWGAAMFGEPFSALTAAGFGLSLAAAVGVAARPAAAPSTASRAAGERPRPASSRRAAGLRSRRAPRGRSDRAA